MTLKAQTCQSGGYPVLALSGEVDLAVKTDLQRALDLFGQQGDKLIVDLSDITYIDSSALGMLIVLSARLRDRSATLVIISEREGLRRIFQTRGLVDLLCFADSRGEAVRRVDAARPGPS